MDPDFESLEGTDFWAHIVADSGMYQYDAIGHLILDQHEGVKISWTPYGKVREVRARNDRLITMFRYDGAGIFLAVFAPPLCTLSVKPSASI